MIRLHCTKKLLAKLPISERGRIVSKMNRGYAANDGVTSLLSGWHANLLLIQRRQCVIFVHDATRFCVFIPALKKADFADLDYRFDDAFMNTQLKCGADDALMNAAHTGLGPLVCDSDCDRSVQGTMNRMAFEVEHMIHYQGVNVAEITGYRVGAWLANRPCTVKGKKDVVWPDRAMRELLLPQSIH